MDITDKPTIPGVADTRGISLDKLAGEFEDVAANALRRVIDNPKGRVRVAAFQSSI